MSSQCSDTLIQQAVRLSHELLQVADDIEAFQGGDKWQLLMACMREAAYSIRILAQEELQNRSAPAAALKSTSTHSSAKKVLIVDDDPDIVTFLARWFEDQGCLSLRAGNGFEAIETAQMEKPDLITLDMSMPEKSGVSTYRDLKCDPELKGIPVIIITAIGKVFGDFIHRRRSMPDPEGFVAKPIDLEELTAAVHRLLV